MTLIIRSLDAVANRL